MNKHQLNPLFKHPGYNKGGGGAYYDNAEKLYGVQADTAQFMLGLGQQYLPGAVGQYQAATQRYFDPAYEAKMVGKAATDASMAFGQSMDAVNRNMARYGAAFNPNRMASESMNAGLQGAAIKTGAMNNARNYVQDKQFGAAKDFYSNLVGLPSDAAGMAGSAAGGFAAMGTNQANEQASQTAGYGQALGLATGLSFYKDGGVVEAPRMSRGGLLGAGYAAPPPPPTGSGGSASPIMAGLSGAMQGRTIMQALGKQAGQQAAAPIVEAGVSAGTAGGAAAGTAGGAATGTAGGAAAGTAGGTVAAALPWVGAALAIGTLFDMFADGGRVDLEKGGEVRGEGTETSDSIPAWLSDGEYVLNSEAVKMVGPENLDRINHAGLQKRYGPSGDFARIAAQFLATLRSLPHDTRSTPVLEQFQHALAEHAPSRPTPDERQVMRQVQVAVRQWAAGRPVTVERNLGSFAGGFASGLASGFDMRTKLEDRRDRKEIKELHKRGMKRAEEAAAASKNGVYLLDKGMDDKDMPDYAAEDSKNIDFIAQQEEDIQRLQETPTASANPANPANPADDPYGPQGAAWMEVVRRNTSPVPAGRQPPTTAAPSSIGLDSPAFRTYPLQSDLAPAPGTPSVPSSGAVSPGQNKSAAPGANPSVVVDPAQQALLPGLVDPSLARTAMDQSAQPNAQGLKAQGYTRSYIDRRPFSPMDYYHKTVAPEIIGALIGQGRVSEAKAFEDWSRTSKGAAYGETWGKALHAYQSKNLSQALLHLQDLHNRQIPNGQYVTVKPGAKEGTYDVEVRDEKTNRVLGGHTGKLEDIVQLGLGMTTPAEQFNYFTSLAAKAADREQENKANEAKNATALEVARTGAGKPTGAAADMAVWNTAYDQLQTARASGDRSAIARAQAQLDFLNSRTSGLGLANLAFRQETNAVDSAGKRAAGEHAQIRVNDLNRQIAEQQKIIDGEGGTEKDALAKINARKRVKELKDDLVRWENELQKARASGHYK